MIIKHVLLLALMGMLARQSFLAVRDSDRFTFENRTREAIKFLEYYEPRYVNKINSMINHGARNLDGSNGQPISIGRELAYPIVQISAYLATFSLLFLLLDSRVGCLLAIVHSVFCTLVFNFYELIPIWRLLNNIPDSKPTDAAFDNAFFAKQKTWYCDTKY